MAEILVKTRFLFVLAVLHISAEGCSGDLRDVFGRTIFFVRSPTPIIDYLKLNSLYCSLYFSYCMFRCLQA